MGDALAKTAPGAPEWGPQSRLGRFVRLVAGSMAVGFDVRSQVFCRPNLPALVSCKDAQRPVSVLFLLIVARCPSPLLYPPSS